MLTITVSIASSGEAVFSFLLNSYQQYKLAFACLLIVTPSDARHKDGMLLPALNTHFLIFRAQAAAYHSRTIVPVIPLASLL